MTRFRRFLTIPAILVLAALPACGGGEDADTADGPKKADERTPPPDPEFEGRVPPGLSDEPLWSVDDEGATYVLGDTVAFRQYGKGPFFVLRDLKTGERTGRIHVGPKVRKEFDEDEYGKSTRVWSGTWEDEPALFLDYTLTKESDGLSEEQEIRVIDAYGADGKLITTVSQQDIGTASFGVRDGWVLHGEETDRYDLSSGTAAVASPDGEIVLESLCGNESKYDCEVNLEENLTERYQEAFASILEDVAFHAEPVKEDEETERLVATDLSTGKVLWKSDSIEAPRDLSMVEGLNAYPVTMIDDSRVILHWRHSDPGFAGHIRTMTVAVHDLRTGELLLTGPELGIQDGSDVEEDTPPTYVIDEEAQVAVLTGSPDRSHSTAIDLKTGEVLWQQDDEEEVSFYAKTIISGVVYGQPGEFDGDGPLAVGLEDKKVLAKDFDRGAGMPFPQLVQDGKAAIVQHNEATFVFETKR